MCKKYLKNSFVVFLLALVLVFSVPQEAHARNLFRQFFQDIKRATGFIVSLPDKATRWMGPILGPIASGILTQNIASHHKFGQLFNNARRANNAINDIEEQKRLTGEVKDMYRNQATELRNYVKQLEEAREKLREQLIDRDVDLGEYMSTAIELDKMIATVNQTAERFDNSADRLRTQDIIKLAAGSLLNNVVGEIKNVALNELNNEIFDVLNPDIIRILTDQDSRGLDALIEMVLNQGKDQYDGSFDLDKLRDRIRDRMQEILEENKDGWKGNLQTEIQNIINEMVSGAEEVKDSVTTEADEIVNNKPEKNEPINPYSDEELAATLTEIPKDEHGCRPGYEWQRMSGVGCVQKNCSEAGGHYSYTKACICSFVDPKPGDKTKSCMRPSNYLACPSCVFACVGPDDDCPDR